MCAKYKLIFIVESYGKSYKKHAADMIAGQVTVQSEKESILSKKLRKMDKKDKSKYSTVEIKQFSIYSLYHECWHVRYSNTSYR